MDSGIDTTHVEFKPNKYNREVANVYVANSPNSGSPLPPDTDQFGHGTHVAAAIGGNTVGVSPGCSLFGVKVLGGQGEAIPLQC